MARETEKKDRLIEAIVESLKDITVRDTGAVSNPPSPAEPDRQPISDKRSKSKCRSGGLAT